jgi:hypothetical protein
MGHGSLDGPGARSLLVAIRRASKARPTQEAGMEFFCDACSLDGVLVDDLVLSFSAKDDVPIAMALVDTPALGTVTVVMAGKLALERADRLERGDSVTCSGVLHDTTVMAIEVIDDRQHRPRARRHRQFPPDRRRR